MCVGPEGLSVTAAFPQKLPAAQAPWGSVRRDLPQYMPGGQGLAKRALGGQ